MSPESLLPVNSIETPQKSVNDRLQELDIRPHENLGQHFLTDQASIDLITRQVTPGSIVLEVGPGLGHVTEALAARASRVIAIEIDRRFEPILSSVTERNPQVEVIYADAIAANFGSFMPDAEDISAQIVANLPFHITEPFFEKIVGLPVEDITLVVGQKLIEELQAKSENSVGFGRLSLLAQTFFDLEILSRIDKQGFFPPPRTDASIIKLTPKEEAESRLSLRSFVLRRLFESQKKTQGIKGIIKDAIDAFNNPAKTLPKRLHNRHSRRSSRLEMKQVLLEYSGGQEYGSERKGRKGKQRKSIKDLGLPDDFLALPFSRLSNPQLRTLSAALRQIDQDF